MKTNTAEHIKSADEYNKPEILTLVHLCGNGDEESLSIFFERFASDIYNFPIKVFHLDDDSGSDFFLYAYERLQDGARFRSFQGRSSFRTWFYTVLRNLVIDWMRTIREVNTVQANLVDEKGNEYRLIENTPDPRTMPEESNQSLFRSFKENLAALNPELRVIFKLCYLYYLELDENDLEYLSNRSSKSVTELIMYLAEIKNLLAGKELKNLGTEDKITSLYVSILDLKAKRERMLGGFNSGFHSVGRDGVDEFELDRLDRAIVKKYQQRDKLLEKREKGHFIVRTPYKYITELLGIPEGSVSVQMMRAMERIRELDEESEEEATETIEKIR